MISQILILTAICAVFSFGLTACARKLAPLVGLMDQPDAGRKSHRQPTPLLGGAAIYLALLLTWGLAAQWASAQLMTPRMWRLSMFLMISAGAFCLVGLWDDRRPMRARTKLALQILACLPFVIWGRSVESIHLLGIQMHLGVFGTLFTVFWLVGCVNAINLADGLDGLAGTIGLIVCVAVSVHATMLGDVQLAVLPLLIAAGLTGFLLHNWPPARIFLGDSGSLMIGFLVGALAIEGSLKTATGCALALPLVLISIPVFDTFMAIVRRKLKGRGIGEADRGHIHHCLQDRGLSNRQSLIAITALCACMAATTILAAYFRSDTVAVVICATVLVLLIAGRVFGYNETVLLFQYLQTVGSILVETSGLFRSRLTLARLQEVDHHVATRWSDLEQLMATIGGRRLEFQSSDSPEGIVEGCLQWTATEEQTTPNAIWELQYSYLTDCGLHGALRISGHHS
ncbi:MAG: MraY family glycosyltransferase, partial [Planctomycetaceae bacterium]